MAAKTEYTAWIGGVKYFIGGIAMTGFSTIPDYGYVYCSDIDFPDDSHDYGIECPLADLEKVFNETVARFQDIYDSENKTNYCDDVIQFVSDAWTDENWYSRPQKTNYDDAAYNLAEYKKEDVDVPDGLTPAVYMKLWNELCDLHGEE